MPTMRPPTRCRYNGAIVKAEQDVDVRLSDVDALKKAGWSLSGSEPIAPPFEPDATADVEIDADATDTE